MPADVLELHKKSVKEEKKTLSCLYTLEAAQHFQCS